MLAHRAGGVHPDARLFLRQLGRQQRRQDRSGRFHGRRGGGAGDLHRLGRHQHEGRFADALRAQRRDAHPGRRRPCAILSFSGWSTIPNMAEEFKNPAKDVPKAALLSLATCGIIFALFCYVMNGLHAAGAELAAVRLASRGGHEHLYQRRRADHRHRRPICACISTSNGLMMSGSRIPFAMGARAICQEPGFRQQARRSRRRADPDHARPDRAVPVWLRHQHAGGPVRLRDYRILGHHHRLRHRGPPERREDSLPGARLSHHADHRRGRPDLHVHRSWRPWRSS